MKKTMIGGQALIEGIMMKGPHKTVLAVRGKNGEIISEEVSGTDITKLPKIAKIPVIRGVVNFIISMRDGYKSLMRSAELSGFTEIEDEQEKEKDAEKRAKKAYKKAIKTGKTEEEAKNIYETEKARVPENTDDSALMNVIMVIASVLGVALAVVLFMYIPSTVFDFLNKLSGSSITAFKSLIEGVIKIAVFLVYIILVSKMKDIKRVFMYHGAEHKTIFCYEAGDELTVENVRKCKRFHPRCGTSFLIIMLVVGIIVSFLLVTIFPALTSPSMRLIWVAIKILMIPVICGLSYELIKICGKHDNTVTRIISAPGMWVQRITTAEPDDSMIEVAITAFIAVVPEDKSEDEWK